MRNILISIKPEWVEKILNGEKTIEIRKSIPECKLPIKVYIYCTKGNKELRLFNQKVCASFKIPRTKTYSIAQQKAYTKFIGDESQSLNGKVVAEFTLNKYDLLVDYGSGIKYVNKDLYYLDVDYLRTNSCLTDEQIYLYLGLRKNGGYYNDGYVWHIDNLIIYDKPKELSEFSAYIPDNKCGKHEQGFNCKNCDCYIKEYKTCGACYYLRKPLKRPPQSWCYVEEKGEEV